MRVFDDETGVDLSSRCRGLSVRGRVGEFLDVQLDVIGRCVGVHAAIDCNVPPMREDETCTAWWERVRGSVLA